MRGGVFENHNAFQQKNLNFKHKTWWQHHSFGAALLPRDLDGLLSLGNKTKTWILKQILQERRRSVHELKLKQTSLWFTDSAFPKCRQSKKSRLLKRFCRENGQKFLQDDVQDLPNFAGNIWHCLTFSQQLLTAKVHKLFPTTIFSSRYVPMKSRVRVSQA